MITFKRAADARARPARWIWDAAIYLLAAGFFIWPRGGVFENDLFFHIAFGQWMLEGGSTAGNPDWLYGPYGNGNWINTLAPSEVIFALIYQLGGWTAVGLIRDLAIPALLLTSWFTLTRWMPAARTEKTPDAQRLAFFAAPIIVFAVVGAMTVRPQTWSYVLVPVLIAVAVRTARSGRTLNPIFVGLATWVWTCWHGYGLLVAPMLLLALLAHHSGLWVTSGASVGDRTRTALRGLLKASPAVFTALLATLLTPAGIGIYTSAGAIKEAARGTVTEWEPVSPTEPLGMILIAMTGAYLLALWLDGRKGRIKDKAIAGELIAEALIVLGILAVFSTVMRTAVLALLIVMIFVAHRAITAVTRPGAKVEIAAGEEIPSRHWTTVRNTLIIVSVTASALLYPQFATPGVDGTRQPLSIIEQIVGMPGERKVFIQYDSASAMMFAAQQADADVKVSLDSRVDKFGNKIVDNHLSLDVKFEESSWAPYSSSTDAVIFSHSALAKELVARGWKQEAALNGLTPDSEPITWLWLTAPGKGK